jgi:hypothetical protein
MKKQEELKGPVRCKDCMHFRETIKSHKYFVDDVEFTFPDSGVCPSQSMACKCPETVKKESRWCAYAGHYTMIEYPAISQINRDGNCEFFKTTAKEVIVVDHPLDGTEWEAEKEDKK